MRDSTFFFFSPSFNKSMNKISAIIQILSHCLHIRIIRQKISEVMSKNFLWSNIYISSRLLLLCFVYILHKTAPRITNTLFELWLRLRLHPYLKMSLIILKIIFTNYIINFFRMVFER